jgi:hypothetical protein
MKTEKGFDSVKMMREIRDKLSKQFANMSYEEQKEYIRKRIKSKDKALQGIENNSHIAR